MGPEQKEKVLGELFAMFHTRGAFAGRPEALAEDVWGRLFEGKDTGAYVPSEVLSIVMLQIEEGMLIPFEHNPEQFRWHDRPLFP